MQPGQEKCIGKMARHVLPAIPRIFSMSWYMEWVPFDPHSRRPALQHLALPLMLPALFLLPPPASGQGQQQRCALCAACCQVATALQTGGGGKPTLLHLLHVYIKAAREKKRSRRMKTGGGGYRQGRRKQPWVKDASSSSRRGEADEAGHSLSESNTADIPCFPLLFDMSHFQLYQLPPDKLVKFRSYEPQMSPPFALC
jgi:hypothetical protein